MTLPDEPTGEDGPNERRRASDVRDMEGYFGDELSGAELYDALSKAEGNPDLAHIYDRLARVEQSHAEYWRSQIEDSGGTARARTTPLRNRVLIYLARRFGPAMVRPAIRAGEARDAGKYDAVPQASRLALQEKGHARILSEVLRSDAPDGLSGRRIAKLEGRHRSGGNALRAAVLGANDGLLSNFSLIMGVAGGAGSGSAVVLAGIAGLVAGAFSMALGEWLSVTNARELYTSQIATERAELEANPDEEREELALIYQAKGIPQDEAETMAAHIVANADAALDRLAREELGIDPDELGGSAMTAAATSFGLFAFGAAIPLVPLMAFKENTALVGSMIAAGIGLLAFGAAAALVTGQGLWRGALRQLAIGGVAAGATFSIGKLVGQTVGA